MTATYDYVNNLLKLNNNLLPYMVYSVYKAYVSLFQDQLVNLIKKELDTAYLKVAIEHLYNIRIQGITFINPMVSVNQLTGKVLTLDSIHFDGEGLRILQDREKMLQDYSIISRYLSRADKEAEDYSDLFNYLPPQVYQFYFPDSYLTQEPKQVPGFEEVNEICNYYLGIRLLLL